MFFFFLMLRRPPVSTRTDTLFPYTTLCRSYYVNNSGGLTSGRQPTDSFPPNIFSDLSSFIPGGVFSGKSSSRDRFYRNGVLVPLGPDVQTGEPIEIGDTDNGNKIGRAPSELQSLMRTSYAVFCLKKKKQ